MITMTGLVFSVTIVALQLAAGQSSSRVMRDFLRDRVIQWTFGVFVATFSYAMVLQRDARGVSGGAHVAVPQLGMSLAFVLVLASVALFVGYINRIANSIRVANIVARIGARTRATITARYPLNAPAAPPPHPMERRTTGCGPRSRGSSCRSTNRRWSAAQRSRDQPSRWCPGSEITCRRAACSSTDTASA